MLKSKKNTERLSNDKREGIKKADSERKALKRPTEK